MTSGRPRLLLVSCAGGGGVREAVAGLVRQLPALGWDIVPVFASPNDPDGLAAWAAARGLDVRILPTLPVRPGPATWLRRFMALRRLVREHEPSIVHVHYPLPHVPPWDIAGLSATAAPVVATCHTAEWQPWRICQSNRAGARRVATFTAVSESVAEAMRGSGIPGAKLRIVFNGIPLDAFRPRERREREGSGPLVIGCVARLVPVKRIDVLIDAVATLADLPVELVVVGEGPLLGELEQRAASKLPGRARFLGYRHDVGAELGNFDIFALTSDREGMPLALLEAEAAGLPVVATSGPGTAGTVIDGVTGFLAPVGDGPAVGAAIRRLTADPALRRRMGEAGRAMVVAHFSEGRMAADYDALFRGVLAAAGRH